jgi:hypothetical protein
MRGRRAGAQSDPDPPTMKILAVLAVAVAGLLLSACATTACGSAAAPAASAASDRSAHCVDLGVWRGFRGQMNQPSEAGYTWKVPSLGAARDD